MRPASLLGDNGYLGRVVMSKQSQHVLVTLPHPLLLASLGLVAFIFTLFSLELSRFGAQLAPLWFPTSIMMVAFYRHAGKMWPGIALACSLGNIAGSLLFFPGESLSFTYTAINIIEAVVGAMLLRKLLPLVQSFTKSQRLGAHGIRQRSGPSAAGRRITLVIITARNVVKYLPHLGAVRIHRRAGAGTIRFTV